MLSLGFMVKTIVNIVELQKKLVLLPQWLGWDCAILSYFISCPFHRFHSYLRHANSHWQSTAGQPDPVVASSAPSISSSER